MVIVIVASPDDVGLDQPVDNYVNAAPRAKDAYEDISTDYVSPTAPKAKDPNFDRL